MFIVSQPMEFPDGVGERNVTMPVLFNKPIAECHVALAGYEAQYTNDDHHIKRITVMLSCSIGAHVDDGFEVNVHARFNLRDENADDRFSGKINFVLFAIPRSILPPIVER
jgi:hypothetical protein